MKTAHTRLVSPPVAARATARCFQTKVPAVSPPHAGLASERSLPAGGHGGPGPFRRLSGSMCPPAFSGFWRPSARGPCSVLRDSSMTSSHLPCQPCTSNISLHDEDQPSCSAFWSLHRRTQVLGRVCCPSARPTSCERGVCESPSHTHAIFTSNHQRSPSLQTLPSSIQTSDGLDVLLPGMEPHPLLALEV